MQIELAESDEEIDRCFPVMAQLRPHLERENFVAQVRRQQEREFHLAYLETEGRIQTVAGFRFHENLAHGLHLYVDDLVTDQNARSGGCGGAMLDWLVDRARQHNCTTLALDSGVQRGRAHRFYFARGLQITSYRFGLKLD